LAAIPIYVFPMILRGDRDFIDLDPLPDQHARRASSACRAP
jgi:hypothetical protein